MMKRSLLALILIMSLCGCSQKEEASDRELLDLTLLSETMAYSQMINIIKEPQEYLGSLIRVKGIYTAPFNGFTQEYNYTVTVQDNTQCCAQGIEFVLKKKDDLKKLPEEGDEITVEGILAMFEEGKHSYCIISDAKLGE